MEEFSEKLKKLRKQYGFSQSYMAKKLNISQPGYAKYENSSAEPDYERLKIIAQIFNVSIDYLLNNQSTQFINNNSIIIYNKDKQEKYNLNEKRLNLINQLAEEMSENKIKK